MERFVIRSGTEFNLRQHIFGYLVIIRTNQLPYKPDIPISQADDDIELLPEDQNELTTAQEVQSPSQSEAISEQVNPISQQEHHVADSIF